MTEKLFTLGPVEMFDYTRERLAERLPYFRTDEFSKINLECARRLKRLLGAPPDSHVFLLTCSGSGAMEAVVGGCFSGDAPASDRLLVVDGGGFGHRFAELAAHHRIPHESVKVDFGETLALGAIEEKAASGGENAGMFTGLLVNHHETSTGQLYDIKTLASFCRSRGLYFVCDAISSFLADPLDFEQDGIDALIISSQKALALPPGLSAVVLSDRMYRKLITQDIRPFALYFDFRDAESNAARGQTPFTPAVGVILALRDRLERIEAEGGAAKIVGRTRSLAADFRARIAPLIEAELVNLPAHPLSNACTPVIFPRGDAKAVYERLSYGDGVWLNPNGGALADTVLRVGHLGNLDESDNAALADLLADALRAGA